MPTSSAGNRLIVVSNRLPIVLSKTANGKWEAKPGSGGLVSALVPVLRDRGGIWVGWPGAALEDAGQLEGVFRTMTRGLGYTLKPVLLTAEEVHGFYLGFSNEIIWPLFHDLFTNCNFDPAFWCAYEQVNAKFARELARVSRPGDFIWVHDYHFMEMGRELRALGVVSKLGFFLHIPFPPPDIFLKLPWRLDILSALLDFDLLGFQTLRDRRNFLQCLRTLWQDVSTQGKGQVLSLQARDPHAPPATEPGTRRLRGLRVGHFPISIDFKGFAARAASYEVQERLQFIGSEFKGCQMILGVDRLDYTKGLPNKLEAFRNALRRFPALRHRAILVQHVVPSREGIAEYHNLRLNIEQLVSEINGEFAEPGWIPIHYYFHSLQPSELVAYYRAADIALVTPLKDGMNLVAKEYCAARIGDDGVLILSEFAGAAAQLQRGALLVNPHDVEGVANGIYGAVNMAMAERRERMRSLRRAIRGNDIFRWVDSFLDAAIERDLSHFPVVKGVQHRTDSFATGRD